MKKKIIFSDEDKKAIENAVIEAEKQTSGEIVPYFLTTSDDYEESAWKGASYFAVVSMLLLTSMSLTWSLSIPVTPVEVTLAVLIVGTLGFFITRYNAPVKRFFTGKETMKLRTERAAAHIFLSEEIFKTRERTGILILISYYEQQVVVLGDTGINAKVKKEEWQNVVDLIVEGIKSDKAAEGLLKGIAECGSLLSRAGLKIRPDDKDELSNELRG